MVKALVSAATVAAVVRAQADQMHDAARRLGCTDIEADAVTLRAAQQLIANLKEDPASVRDLVGALFLRTRAEAVSTRATRRVGRAERRLPADASVALRQTTAQNAAVETALDTLPDDQRLALLLRDSYGLTGYQSAVALALDPPESARLVALARLALIGALEDQAPLSLVGHDVAVGDLGQLADGSAPPGGRFATLRRHVSGCADCAAVLTKQTRATAILSALPLLAVGRDRAEALVRATDQRATELLPTEAAVRRQLEEGTARRPIVSPALVVAALVAAVLTGGVIGGLLARDDRGSLAPRTQAPTAAGGQSTPGGGSTSTTNVASGHQSPAGTTASGPAEATTSTARTPAITLSPSSGPAGNRVVVTGTGFPAGTVTVTYATGTGTSALAIASSAGTFTTALSAGGGANSVDPPGIYPVRAVGRNGATAQATFTQTTTG